MQSGAAERARPSSATALDRELDQLQRARGAVSEVVFGLAEAVDQVVFALMCGGHVLLEGAAGLG